MSCKDAQSHQLVLAENNRVSSVSICGCGTIHLSLGAISMRLSPEVFGEVVQMMRTASQTLLRRGAELEVASEMVH